MESWKPWFWFAPKFLVQPWTPKHNEIKASPVVSWSRLPCHLPKGEVCCYWLQGSTEKKRNAQKKDNTHLVKFLKRGGHIQKERRINHSAWDDLIKLQPFLEPLLWEDPPIPNYHLHPSPVTHIPLKVLPLCQVGNGKGAWTHAIKKESYELGFLNTSFSEISVNLQGMEKRNGETSTRPFWKFRSSPRCLKFKKPWPLGHLTKTTSPSYSWRIQKKGKHFIPVASSPYGWWKKSGDHQLISW